MNLNKIVYESVIRLFEQYFVQKGPRPFKKFPISAQNIKMTSYDVIFPGKGGRSGKGLFSEKSLTKNDCSAKTKKSNMLCISDTNPELCLASNGNFTKLFELDSPDKYRQDS